MALLKGAVELRKAKNAVAAVYFYNPRYTDSMLLMRYAKHLGLAVVVDQTELFSTINHRSLKDEQYIAKNADLLLVISKKLQSHFEQTYAPKAIYQLTIAVDLDRFSRTSIDLNYTIGYLGSFANKDGIKDILSAYTMAKQVYPELKLKLIGHNAGLNADSMNQTGDIIFTGAINANHIPAELAKCDTLILNRLNNAFSSFGFPYKLGEYLAASRPVLLSDIEGFAKEVPDDVVLKYEAGNVKALIRAILYRYQHTNEMDGLAKAGYQFAIDHYHSKVVTSKFVSIFLKALK